MTATSEMPAGRIRGLIGFARRALSRTDDPALASRAAATALVIRVGNAVLAYVSQVVLARLMGQFEYGVFAYAWVWFLVFTSLAPLGFAESAVRFIPALRERGETDHLRGFLWLGGGVVIAAAVLVGIATALLVMLADRHIESAYVLPMLLLAIVLPFACLQSFLEGVGRSYFWTVPALAPVYILRHGLLLVFMVTAVWGGFEASARTAFACVILTVVISLAYQLVAIARRLRRVLPTGPRAYRPREWILGSLPFSVMYGAAQLFAFADVLVLSFFVSPGEIAVYFAATRVMQVTALIPFAASVGTAQLISASDAAGDRDRMRLLVREIAFWTFILAFAVTLLIVFSGGWVLRMFGEEFEGGYTVLLILAAGMIVRVVAGPAEDLLNMTGHGQLSAWTYVVSMVINIALNVALIIPFGILGAAVATTTAIGIRSVWLALAARRRTGINTWIFGARPSLDRLCALIKGAREEAASPAE